MKKRNTFLKYDWRLHGRDAVFCVNERLYPEAPIEKQPLLVFIHCSSPHGRALKKADFRHIAKLAAKCESEAGVEFAGYIETAVMRQYYIYLADESAFDRLAEIANLQKHIAIKMGSKQEPAWTTYFKLLYPDTAKMQTVRNGETIERLYQIGDSTAPRRLNLHMYFRSEYIRMEFEHAARLEGFAIGDPETREHDVWEYEYDENDEQHECGTPGSSGAYNESNVSDQYLPADKAVVKGASLKENIDEADDTMLTPAPDWNDGFEVEADRTGTSEYFESEVSQHTPDANRLDFGVVLHRICAMRKRDVDAVTVQAIRIAERYRGVLLFWDCPIVPRSGR